MGARQEQGIKHTAWIYKRCLAPIRGSDNSFTRYQNRQVQHRKKLVPQELKKKREKTAKWVGLLNILVCLKISDEKNTQKEDINKAKSGRESGKERKKAERMKKRN